MQAVGVTAALDIAMLHRHCYSSQILNSLDGYLALDIANNIESVATLWGCMPFMSCLLQSL